MMYKSHTRHSQVTHASKAVKAVIDSKQNTKAA